MKLRLLKGILVCSLCIQTIALAAQGGTIVTRKPRNYTVFQIGGMGSTNICFRTLENTRSEISVDQLIDLRNDGETMKFGYQAGIGFCINVSENFGVETGVQYSNMGFETKLMDFIYAFPEPGAPIQGRSIFNLNYIQIPLKGNIFIGKGKVKFYSSIGVQTNALVNQNETWVLKYEDGRTEYEVFDSNYPLEKVHFSGMIEAGIDVKFSKYIHLRAAPNFSHSIGRVVDAPLSTYLWTAGMGVQFYYGWY